MKFQRPKIRTILILINLFILILPLASIGLLRLYENTLIRKTESSLIAQSAFLAAIYKSRITTQESLDSLPDHYGNAITPNQKQLTAPRLTTKVAGQHRRQTSSDSKQRWKPRYAVLDISHDRIFDKPLDAVISSSIALAAEIKAGRETEAIMRESQIYTLSGMRVVNTAGIVIASTSTDTGKSILHWREVQQSLKGFALSSLRKRDAFYPRPAVSSISRGTGIRVFVSAPVIHNNRVIAALVLSRTPATLTQSLYNNKNVLILMMAGLVFIVTLLSIITSTVISRPVQAVALQAKMVAEGVQGEIHVLQSPRTLEVEELSNAVVTMRKALEKRALFIQDFASQVSHAFKTPLTAIQGAIELLREHYDTMTDTERSQFLSNLDSDSKYLESLVNRLLDLAKADNSIVNTQHKTDVAELLNRLQARANNKNIEITLVLDNKPLFAAIDSTVLESILQNLIDNSVQHGAPPIRVHAQQASDHINANITIEFQDEGPGISDANAVSIFKPFFTTARERGGTGLGLAVIKTLLDNYHGHIELKPSRSGACFVLTLKQ
ncbi:hypothetical protein MNBD_GAMMA12-3627 [hydrothermal vent metagenome]|uniref:histidine kinase n=1 Tax=hydrothermal vent metagenome TaxID=652676 RepID=A0A3B0XRZ3_9ZZZZ